MQELEKKIKEFELNLQGIEVQITTHKCKTQSEDVEQPNLDTSNWKSVISDGQGSISSFRVSVVDKDAPPKQEKVCLLCKIF